MVKQQLIALFLPGIVTANLHPLRILYGEGKVRTYFFLPSNKDYENTHNQTGRYNFAALDAWRVLPIATGLHWAVMNQTQATLDVAASATILALDKNGETEQFTVDIRKDGKGCFENVQYTLKVKGEPQMITAEMEHVLYTVEDELKELCEGNRLRSLPARKYFDFTGLKPGKYEGWMRDEMDEEVEVAHGKVIDELMGVKDVTKNFSDNKMIQAGGFIIAQVRFHDTGKKAWNDLYLILIHARSKLSLRRGRQTPKRAEIPSDSTSYGMTNIASWRLAVRYIRVKE
ncbi:hypothetical protein FOZ60_010104 [Perkinsus olseni]|uniref:Uncharacterized protein n=1 Tax=Perkinsus olseni TaxID=32597 RepID=A0A7J6NH06_PEROL|nr:hypothetical protein FOZ60_010104 [Perkinsus olseni]